MKLWSLERVCNNLILIVPNSIVTDRTVHISYVDSVARVATKAQVVLDIARNVHVLTDDVRRKRLLVLVWIVVFFVWRLLESMSGGSFVIFCGWSVRHGFRTPPPSSLPVLVPLFLFSVNAPNAPILALGAFFFNRPFKHRGGSSEISRFQ